MLFSMVSLHKLCQKGCWMDVKVAEGDTMMVRFKDYGFFVPKEGAEDLGTIMYGTAKMDTISVDLLRHYAEDLVRQKIK